MKRIHIFWFLSFLLTGMLYSCFEDKGNYDYNYAPEVIVQGNEGQLRDTIIKRGQRLTIIPDLQMLITNDGEHKDTITFDGERFEYLWRVYGRLTTDYSGILATSRNLDTIIDLPLSNNPYQVIYSVTDKETNVAWNFKFNLRVENRYENAWLFLVEDDNQMVDLTQIGH